MFKSLRTLICFFSSFLFSPLIIFLLCFIVNTAWGVYGGVFLGTRKFGRSLRFLFFYFSIFLLLKISPYLLISRWGGTVWWGVMDGLYVDSQDID